MSLTCNSRAGGARAYAFEHRAAQFVSGVMGCRLSLALVLFVLLAADIAHAQEAAFVPCRQPELEALSFLVGAWDVDAEVRLSREGPWETSTGTAEISRDVGGCVFVENFTGTRQGRALEARAILAWHPDRAVVQRLFVDSDHGLLLITEGEGVSGGKDLEVFADVETRMGPVRLRTAYREISANGFVVESARSIDGGATWDVTSRLRYTRKDD